MDRSTTRWLGSIAVALAVLLLSTSCVQTSVSSQPPVNISIAGSTAFFPVLFDLGEAFSARYPNVVFDIRGGGSQFGESQLNQGKVDLAATTYLASGLAGELADGQTDGQTGGAAENDASNVPNISIPIGLDGVAIIVNRKNRIQSLTLLELQEIYSGRFFDWSELGETAGQIQLVIREEDSGVQTLFEERVMGGKPLSLTAVIMPTNVDVLQFVALHPMAIGYISRGYVSPSDTNEGELGGAASEDIGTTPDAELGNANQPAEAAVAVGVAKGQNALSYGANSYLESLAAEQSMVTTVAIDGQLPTRDNVLGQQYYLVHPLYLISSQEPTGWLSLYIDFVLSPTGQSIVRRYHAPVR